MHPTGTNQFLRLSGTPSIRRTLMQQELILEYFSYSDRVLVYVLYIYFIRSMVHTLLSAQIIIVAYP